MYATHFPVPPVDRESWRLRVAGMVEREVSLSLSELKQMAVDRGTAVLECAGNGGDGNRLRLIGVGVAEWEGVWARSVLDIAGVSPEARFVTARGLDNGEDLDTPGVSEYERSIPLEVFRERGLLAWGVGDEPLSLEHGYPLRLVLPGWYGMDWIKWLSLLSVTDKPSCSPYMELRYRKYQDENRDSYGPVVREMALNPLYVRECKIN